MPENQQKESPPENIREEKEPKDTAEEAAYEIQKLGNFISLYGIILFSMAIVLDLVGLIIFVLSFFGIGIPISYILDIIGVVFIGGLMFLSPSGGVVLSKGANKLTKKIAKKIGKKLGLSFIGELIPFVGDFAPFWTIAVYYHLKGS